MIRRTSRLATAIVTSIETPQFGRRFSAEIGTAVVTTWETTFARWARSPGQTEEQRTKNAVTAIRRAVNADPELRSVTRVYVQGSYRNRVNVRDDSDADVGILYTGGAFHVTYPTGVTDADVGNVNSSYQDSTFKDQVGATLIAEFGFAAVQRGSKAFSIRETSNRIDADVVPVFRHRRYSSDLTFVTGVQLWPDRGSLIVNLPERLYDDPSWPDQHYEEGSSKNTRTKRSYRGVVRILKTLRNELDDSGIATAKPISGFLVECLVSNVPDDLFLHATWDGDVQAALSFLLTNMASDETCSEWSEVSGWKYLFRGAQAPRRAEAHAFTASAWDHVGVR